ncbi:MAG: winged helix DNA-binding protein [Thermoleophilaceae bacterium]|nr:winged helix DNA-binding protein [Thermoleophilaceae bacterium]
MLSSSQARESEQSTVTLLSLTHLVLSRQVAEGAARAGHPVKPSHSAVFGQMTAEGSRLTELARRANMTPQAMGELVDELEGSGYLVRKPDPTDRRAKRIMLTESGHECVAAGVATIGDIERRITEALGARGHRQLRRMLLTLLAES